MPILSTFLGEVAEMQCLIILELTGMECNKKANIHFFQPVFQWKARGSVFTTERSKDKCFCRSGFALLPEN